MITRFQLQDIDKLMIEALYYHRMLTINQLHRLLVNPQSSVKSYHISSLRRRINKLIELGIVSYRTGVINKSNLIKARERHFYLEEDSYTYIMDFILEIDYELIDNHRFILKGKRQFKLGRTSFDEHYYDLHNIIIDVLLKLFHMKNEKPFTYSDYGDGISTPLSYFDENQATEQVLHPDWWFTKADGTKLILNHDLLNERMLSVFKKYMGYAKHLLQHEQQYVERPLELHITVDEAFFSHKRRLRSIKEHLINCLRKPLSKGLVKLYVNNNHHSPNLIAMQVKNHEREFLEEDELQQKIQKILEYIGDYPLESITSDVFCDQFNTFIAPDFAFSNQRLTHGIVCLEVGDVHGLFRIQELIRRKRDHSLHILAIYREKSHIFSDVHLPFGEEVIYTTMNDLERQIGWYVLGNKGETLGEHRLQNIGEWLKKRMGDL